MNPSVWAVPTRHPPASPAQGGAWEGMPASSIPPRLPLSATVAGAVWYAAEVLNHLQFLTIRRYLGFVFAALVILLLALVLWQ